MIAAVRAAVQRLGAATPSEIQAETGLPDWQVEHCLEHLLRRGDIRAAAAAAASCRARPKPASACKHCPLESVCAADAAAGSRAPAAAQSSRIYTPVPRENYERI